MENCDVYIVDDDELVLENVRRSLRETRLRWHVTTDTNEAFLYLQNHSPSILIVDQRMPRVNGIDLLEQVNATRGLKDSDVYLCSSSTPPEHIQQRTKHLNGRLLPKSTLCNKEKLLDLMQKLIFSSETDSADSES